MPKLPFTPDRGFIVQARLTAEVVSEYTKPSILEAVEKLVRQDSVDPVWCISIREVHKSWTHRSYSTVKVQDLEEVISRGYNTPNLTTALQYFAQEVLGVELTLPPTAADQLLATSEKIEEEHRAGTR